MTFEKLWHSNTRIFDTPNNCAAIQRGLYRLQKWLDRNFTNFNEGKCKVLGLGRNNPMY